MKRTHKIIYAIAIVIFLLMLVGLIQWFVPNLF
jgi:flagellar basal body-associated protein FliL